MKQTATKEIAARIDEIQGKLNAGGNGHQTKALYDELSMILDKFETFDIVFEENGKKGLKDIAGRVRVPALYEDFAETYSYHWGRSMPVAARGLTPLSPPSELQEIPVAIREQSGVLCFHSR